MNIKDINKMEIKQQILNNCEYQFAIYNIELENLEPIETHINEYDTKLTYVASIELSGYILPINTKCKPNKCTLYIRECIEQVISAGSDNEKITYSNNKFRNANALLEYVIYQLRELNNQIIIDNKECLILPIIIDSKYSNQCKIILK